MERAMAMVHQHHLVTVPTLQLQEATLQLMEALPNLQATLLLTPLLLQANLQLVVVTLMLHLKYLPPQRAALPEHCQSSPLL
jgi:hypothetical protein